MQEKSVLITGASGLLGRALYKKFQEKNWKVHAQAFSRCKDGMVKLDLCDFSAVRDFINTEKPSLIMHSAAQRSPDIVEKDFTGTLKLNVEASRNIADAAKNIGSSVIYMSTDYVFDGTSPPYAEDSITNPLNKYGVSKMQGENAVMEVDTGNVVVRVPILYGPVIYLKESAVSYMLEFLLGDNLSSTTLSNYEIRYPTHVDDVASVCEQLAALKLQGSVTIEGIYHCSADEPLTKYEMLKTMASVFSLSHSHVSPDSKCTPGAPRPYNSKLSTKRLKELGLGSYRPFSVGIKESIQEYVQ